MTCDRTGFTSKTISLSPSLVVFASSYRRTPFTLNGNGNDKQLDLTGNRVIRRGTLNIQFAMLTVDSLLIFCMQSSAQLCLYLIKNNYTIMHLIIKLFEICNSVSPNLHIFSSFQYELIGCNPWLIAIARNRIRVIRINSNQEINSI